MSVEVVNVDAAGGEAEGIRESWLMRCMDIKHVHISPARAPFCYSEGPRVVSVRLNDGGLVLIQRQSDGLVKFSCSQDDRQLVIFRMNASSVGNIREAVLQAHKVSELAAV